jgi:hypothetical protein
MRASFVGSLLFFVGLSALACSSSSSTSTETGTDAGTDAPATACAATGTGTLALEITGLPAATDASVAVGDRAVAATSSSSVAGGEYTVTAKDVVVADPIVRSVYRPTVTGSPACVKDGATTTVKVAYALVPTSHALWLTNQNGAAEVVGIRQPKLASSATTPADVSSTIIQPTGIAFDKEGNLWTVGSEGGGTRALQRYPASGFAASGTPTADVIISGDALNFGAPSVGGIAFDASGNMWVAALAAKKILRYNAADLRASGSPTPVEAVTGLSTQQIAFDAAGNLWATAEGNAVVEYAAARLTSPITTAPDISITANTPSPVITNLQAPSGLAFDASNQLWVAYNGSTVVRFTAAERAASGDITPAVQLTLSVLALAEGLAFDEGGGLWLAYSLGKVARLGPDQLTASATVTPSTVLEATPISSGNAIALFPAPANVPVFGKP